MSPNRLSDLSSAFRAIPLTCGPLTLRPMTAGSVLLLMDTENALFAGKPTTATENGDMDGLFQFIHIHTAPIEQVLQDCENLALLRRRARALGLSISFEDLAEFSEKFQQIQARMNSAIVEIIPEKNTLGKPPKETPPRTGLPPSSTLSVVPEIPPESITSSGASPSIAPSNTSTQPIPQTESAPVGRSRIWEPEPLTPEPEPPHLIPLP